MTSEIPDHIKHDLNAAWSGLAEDFNRRLIAAANSSADASLGSSIVERLTTLRADLRSLFAELEGEDSDEARELLGEDWVLEWHPKGDVGHVEFPIRAFVGSDDAFREVCAQVVALTED